MTQRNDDIRNANLMLVDDKLPHFCRWLGEVWSSRGLDVVCEMLEKPWNWMEEWGTYQELVAYTGDVCPQITADEIEENLENMLDN